jgi:predicted HicB family RNase H-like nuclease
MQEIEKEKNKRLALDISEKLHAEIKSKAAYSNISMKAYILRAVIEKMEYEKRYE